MTVDQWLSKSNGILKDSGIKTARLDSLVLLEDALKRNRANLLAHPEQRIPIQTEVNLNNKITQRSRHIPLAYIRGKAEFYGRQFAVNSSVLVPRPETESIIEITKSLELPKHTAFLDVGTGSGAVAITVKLERPDLHAFAADISVRALKTAQTNALKLDADIHFYRANLLEPPPDTKQKIYIILANLPYVPDDYPINKAAQFEPKAALFAGKDGLDLYRRFWAQIKALTHQPRYIITESLPFQHATNASLAHTANFSLAKTDGLVQLFCLKATG